MRLLPALVILALASPSLAGEVEVRLRRVDDLKAVAATVESEHEAAARARLGGTVTDLATDEGQRVEAGQRLATVADTKLAPQIGGAEARIKSLEAERDLARTEFQRSAELFEKGAGTKMRLDAARTRLEVAERAIAAARSERTVLTERSGEGAVLAPANGRVLKVHVTEGSVVLPGDVVATIAVENYALRLALPERHARFIKVGDTVLVGPRALGMADQPPRTGVVRKVYPRIENGRVTADVTVDGLGDFFVGERIPVHVSTGSRDAFVLPRDAISRRLGLDVVRLKSGGEVVVQTGQITADGVEILSGLRDGDVVTW
ncbi:efflux RND transporter periplasmic adaptor subunit [Magnetospirillum sp. SS-4]|uniref:efflux RND transporter periplasmic adaptor subunit n=1 Tax=Magnetospirillum sp. SS-4 TaxID=2681465 RepID=UPI0013830191|nr:efflux RND transporter periplasmic adaptor subunit [Magnetospirillum sp. SS-4]CAA7612453.1 putative membrane fusion protein, component of an efflux pump (RND family, MFP subunit) [Magnetospirillum sp. SS-4]